MMNNTNGSENPAAVVGKRISRVKQEDTCETLPRMIVPATVATPPSAMNRISPRSPLNVEDTAHSQGYIDPDGLLAVPPAKAVHSCFPPGCIVLRVDADPLATQTITLGSIEAVLVDLMSSGSAGTFVYRFLPHPPFHERGSVLTRASALRLGRSCPVWARPLHATTDKRELPAVVLGSYVHPEGVFYSVQEAGGQVQYDGIPSSSVRYRSDQDTSIREASVRPASTPLRKVLPDRELNSERPTVVRRTPSMVSPSPASSEGSPRSKKMKRFGSNEQSDYKLGAKAISVQREGQPRYGLHGESIRIGRSYDESSLVTEASGSRNSNKRKRAAERKLIIPKMVDADDLKDLLIGKNGCAHMELQTSLRCKIHLRGYPFEANAERNAGAYCLLTGSDQVLESAADTIEGVLVQSIDVRQRGLFLYRFAKLNALGSSIGRAVHYRSPSDPESKTWMTAMLVRNQTEFDNHISLFMGKGKLRFKALVDECRCSVTRVEAEECSPHFYITGDSAVAVNHAYQLFKEKWEWAKRTKAGLDRR